MESLTTQPVASVPVSGSSWRSVAPIAALIFLSPVLAELLMGIVRISNLWLLIPEMGVYGVGALLIRETVRRRRRGWGTILLLGIAYAIAEECVILQTSLTPQFFPPAHAGNFGWAFGVQWIFLVAMLWYESVYAVVLPIYLTEILFPSRRDEPWLERRGFRAASVVFVLASIGVYFLWHYVGLQKFGPSTYRVPLAYVGVALVVIVGIVGGTLAFRPAQPHRRAERRAWPPWLVGVLAFIHGLVWFVMIALAFLPATALPGASPPLPIAIGLAWVGLGLLGVRYLSRARGWNDRHRLALIFGATLAAMLGGVLIILNAPPVDQIGKLCFDLIAIILFARLAWHVRRRASEMA
ncbi:MAG TPA: hypothetical protein VFG50_14875 [Rhodothermales bacterium]|nr:hypothetical protein [Rhodothermales bacterium]